MILKDHTIIHMTLKFKKCISLERFGLTDYDISEMNFPSLERIHHEKLFSICSHHDGAYKVLCAARNVKLLKKFYLENSSTPMEIE